MSRAVTKFEVLQRNDPTKRFYPFRDFCSPNGIQLCAKDGKNVKRLAITCCSCLKDLADESKRYGENGAVEKDSK